ncbi:hypothetical protein [Microcoleus sp. POL10_C6]|uniref:hypothetical protein n=1 Tax=unclassified Microcoleus TaxID=2642155 RepID=UPI002FD551D1
MQITDTCAAKAIKNRRRKFGNEQCTRCNGCQEEGSSATSNVQDVTDVRKKEEGRRKREEGRAKREENSQLTVPNPRLPITNYQLPVLNA